MWKNEHHTEHNQKVNINCSTNKCQQMALFNGTFDFPCFSIARLFASHSEIVEYLSHEFTT